MTQNLDRFKFRGFYKDKIYEVFSFCDEFVKLKVDNDVIKVARTDVILMQSTGLKDKNGRLIYEGDVIFTSINNKVISFFEGCFGYHEGLYKIVETQDDFIAIDLQKASKCEIIGNIYEHEHLLKS